MTALNRINTARLKSYSRLAGDLFAAVQAASYLSEGW
jgi:hypothetical protein